MNRLIAPTNIVTLVLLVLSFGYLAPVARAQHEGHDMSGMTNPKRKPFKKAPPKKKPQPAEQKKSVPEQPASVTTPSPEVITPETKVARPEPDTSPSPSLPSTTESVPATDSLPVSSPSPAAVGPNKIPVSDHSGMSEMDMSGADNGKQPTGSVPKSAGDTSLMIMSKEQMDIRIGASKRNSIAMGQMGSGTSWLPATTPMYMWFKSAGTWLIFLHGDVKLGVNHQGGPRGVTKFESQNWIMPMAFRRVGAGTLQLRGMFSLEPFTFPPGGSPLLFQTGETYRGIPLVDAQHPHDLFMELSGSYTLPIGERATWFSYLGFPGEPALGPTAFMHRMSASENPSAPLSHHLQDSTHISFGVFTTGFTYRWFKLEGSLFNGREPDENRYDFEFNPWNSRSFRISVAPGENWSAQWSYGLLKSPEAFTPGDVRRMTASISYNKRVKRGNWATSLIWGRNKEFHDEIQTLNGYTAESTLNFLDKNYVYTRLELADKNSLLSHDEAHNLGYTTDHPTFRIGAYSFGYVRDVWNTSKISIGIGSDVTFYSKPDELDGVYGDNPTSNRFFVRIRPGRMSQGQGHTHQ